MKQILLVLIIFFSVSNVFAQPDLCTTASNLTPTTDCVTGVTTNQSLQNSTATGSPTNAAGTTNDVWYRFITPATITSVVINLTSPGLNIQGNTYIEAFASTASCNSGILTGSSLGTSTATTGGGTSISLTSLAASTQYYFRVFTTAANTTSNPANNWRFSICVSYVAVLANDLCSNPTNVLPLTNCGATVNQTLLKFNR